jgi:hypothetical protein
LVFAKSLELRKMRIYLLLLLACCSSNERVPRVELPSGGGGGTVVSPGRADAGSDGEVSVSEIVSGRPSIQDAIVAANGDVLFVDEGDAVVTSGVYRVPLTGTRAPELAYTVAGAREITRAESGALYVSTLNGAIVQLGSADPKPYAVSEDKPLSLLAVGTSVYWLAGGDQVASVTQLRMGRSPPPAVTLASVQGGFTTRSLVADTQAQALFFVTNAAGSGGTLSRVSLANPASAEPLAVLSDAPQSLALGTVRGVTQLYVATPGAVSTVNPSTGSVSTLVQTASADHLFVQNETLYWATDSAVWSLSLAPASPAAAPTKLSDIKGIRALRASPRGLVLALQSTIVVLPL